MPIGHSNNGKAADYVQRGCILLAKNGIAALAYDPIGQGERRQLLDNSGKAAIANSTSEHTLVGVGAMLVGSNTATYRVWDGIRTSTTGGRPGGCEAARLHRMQRRRHADLVPWPSTTASGPRPSCYLTSLGGCSRRSARRTRSRTSLARWPSAWSTPTT
jgi:hypothetical protein